MVHMQCKFILSTKQMFKGHDEIAVLNDTHQYTGTHTFSKMTFCYGQSNNRTALQVWFVHV